MMSTESGILLKNHISCNFMLKYCITMSLQQFTKTLNQFFDYLGQTKICKLACLSLYNPAGITFSNLTIETLEQGVKYVQS